MTFTSKIGVALEEADESFRWLRFIAKAEFLTGETISALIEEAASLRAILNSSHLTAKRNRSRYRHRDR